MMHTRFTVEESDPKGVRTILHQRFLEALDASVCENQKDIVLVLDKPGLRMINQLICSICFFHHDRSHTPKQI